VRLSNSVDVYDSRIVGGMVGIHADGRGGLDVGTRVRICGNEIVGSPAYEYGVRIGLASRGPLLVRGNRVTLVDGLSTGIRVDAANELYAGLEDRYAQMHVLENVVLGAAGVGISSANPQEIGRNWVELSPAASTGVHLTNPSGMFGGGLPLPIVGNLVVAGGVGVRIESPSFVHIASVNNTVRAARALWISDFPGASDLVAVNNIFDSTAGDSIEIGGGVFGALDSVTLHNNDLRGAPCLLSRAASNTCVATVADLNACAWASCAGTSANVSVDPRYVSTSDWHLAAGSPLIGAGRDPATSYGGWLSHLDIDAEARPNAGWDVGADER
jgi:hypothetical protein